MWASDTNPSEVRKKQSQRSKLSRCKRYVNGQRHPAKSFEHACPDQPITMSAVPGGGMFHENLTCQMRPVTRELSICDMVRSSKYTRAAADGRSLELSAGQFPHFNHVQSMLMSSTWSQNGWQHQSGTSQPSSSHGYPASQ